MRFATLDRITRYRNAAWSQALPRFDPVRLHHSLDERIGEKLVDRQIRWRTAVIMAAFLRRVDREILDDRGTGCYL